jgi:hypothetical protein
MRTDDDATGGEGMSANALKQRADGKEHKAVAAVEEKFSGRGTRTLDAGENRREVWHYRQEILPKGFRFLQVDVEFINKKGYGVNVLQRPAQTVSTLEAARVAPVEARRREE